MKDGLSFRELFDYTAEERAKWEGFFQKHPGGLAAPLQSEGRFPDVWSLIDHIFLVEFRHARRLSPGQPLPESSGVSPGDAEALFAFGRESRRAAEAVAGNLPEGAMHFESRTLAIEATARKLLAHMLIHEIRHWAQIATAAHNSGLTVPGSHDLLFSSALS